MGKVKFVSNEGNFTAKGYVLNEVYETGPRTESGKNPGKFYYHVTGKNIAVSGLNEWETNLFLYFKFPSNSEEANQANAYLATLKAATDILEKRPDAPVAQAAPVIQPAGPGLIQQINPQITLTPVQENRTANLTEAVRHDILLSGLTQLDFTTLNISIQKTSGKVTLTVIMDGMPPLAINSGDIAAAFVLEKIVSTFSESSQIVSTIREWRKGLSELQAELAKESVETKIKVDAKAKRTAKAKEVPVVETAIPNEPDPNGLVPVEPTTVEPVEILKPVYMDDSLDIPPVESETPEELEPEETQGNGLDPDVDEFQLK